MSFRPFIHPFVRSSVIISCYSPVLKREGGGYIGFGLSVILSICSSVHSSVIIFRSPQGFWGSGENGYLFSGSWGALVIIFRDLGSKLIVLWI